ncbi:MAG: DUF2089 family protein [Bdellovibrionales bacterium]
MITEFLYHVKCPSCSETMRPKVYCCPKCASRLEGEFRPSPMSGLSQSDQEFIAEFILTRGNLRRLGEKLGGSYPTLKKRLEQVAEHLDDAIKTATAEIAFAEKERSKK